MAPFLAWVSSVRQPNGRLRFRRELLGAGDAAQNPIWGGALGGGDTGSPEAEPMMGSWPPWRSQCPGSVPAAFGDCSWLDIFHAWFSGLLELL